MSDSDICGEIRKAYGSQFVCSPHGEYERIRTPYLYPDGDHIDLFCKTSGAAVTVTDLAETVGWLWMQSAAPRLSPRQSQLIKDMCETHGVEFDKEMLLARCGPGESLAGVVTRVAQAALQVSSLWFTFREASSRTDMHERKVYITGEVAKYLERKGFEFSRSHEIIGRSGRSRVVDFHVQALRSVSLIHVLSAGSRSAATRKCDSAVALWHDLGARREGREAMNFISLLDDKTSGIWQNGYSELLESGDLSRVAYWSRPDELALLVSGAERM